MSRLKKREQHSKGKIGQTASAEPRQKLPSEVYPIFCLRHIHPNHGVAQLTPQQKADLLERLAKLNTIDWNIVNTSDRHGFGTEKIARNAIKPGIPPEVPADSELFVFRYSGKLPFVGYFGPNRLFHILFIERAFNTVYNHG